MSNVLQKQNTIFNSEGNFYSESLFKINLKYDVKDKIKIHNTKEYQTLINVKNKIDNLEDCKLWDKTKKISNDFELVYLPNKKMKTSSVSKYEPLSRSYFKLWEIINDFNLISQTSPIKVAGLAEGPGGFIEAIVNYRKKFKDICLHDKIYGITLRSLDKDIPGWNKASNFLKKNRHVEVSYGEDETGNIYKIANIKHFANLFIGNNKADLVTADGGFDFSTNFNKQEHSSLRIIFCEIVTALTIQKRGGSFVCKIYDSYTHMSISFLFLLQCLYEKVNITKPFTSRPANSEKYLVCQHFKGISPDLLTRLHIIVGTWETIENMNEIIYQIIDFNIIPKQFISFIDKYNTSYFNQQKNNIEKTLDFIEQFKENINYDMTPFYKQIIKKQVNLAFCWCKKYKCKINYDSEFIKSGYLERNRNDYHKHRYNDNIKVI